MSSCNVLMVHFNKNTRANFLYLTYNFIQLANYSWVGAYISTYAGFSTGSHPQGSLVNHAFIYRAESLKIEASAGLHLVARRPSFRSTRRFTCYFGVLTLSAMFILAGVNHIIQNYHLLSLYSSTQISSFILFLVVMAPLKLEMF